MPLSGVHMAPVVVRQALAARGEGQPLPEPVQREMGEHLRLDLARVRIHADSKAADAAQAVNARAFTIGRDIYFGRGRFDPQSTAGRQLLLHELTHVRQSAEGRTAGTSPQPTLADAAGPREREANEVSSWVVRGLPAGSQAPLGTSTVKVTPSSADQDTMVQRAPAQAQEHELWFQPSMKGAPVTRDEKPAGGVQRISFEDTSPSTAASAPAKRSGKDKPFFESLDPLEGESTSGTKTLVIDEKLYTAGPVGKLGPVYLRFAWMEGQVKLQLIENAKAWVQNALIAVLADLFNFQETDPSAPHKQETIRARLAESMAGLTSARPLYVYIDTDRIPRQPKLAGNAAAETDRVYVRHEDIGNPKKLEAAVRLPLDTVIAGDANRSQSPEKTPMLLRDTLLHESLHVMLARRGIDANSVWASAGIKVSGPERARQVGIHMLRLYLIAQEEIFTHEAVEQLYPTPSNAMAPTRNYRKLVEAVEVILEEKGAAARELVRTAIKVGGKVGKKDKAWEIAFRGPSASLDLTEADVSTIRKRLLNAAGIDITQNL